MSLQNTGDDGFSEALAPVEPIIPHLPMIVSETGLEVVDWGRLLPEKAELGKASSLIQYEVEALAGIDYPHAQVRANRVISASGTILDLVDGGKLATMGDVATMIDFVVDNNPKLSRVGELFEKDHTIEDICMIYSARETLNVSIGTVEALCAALGIEFEDSDMLEVVSDAIDAVISYRNLDPRFRDIAAQIVTEYAEEGKTLADILDLKG